MYNLLKKYIISHHTLKLIALCFFLCLFVAPYVLLLIQNTEAAELNTAQAETASNPCSIYDNDWGISDKQFSSTSKFVKGIYNGYDNGSFVFGIGSLNEKQKSIISSIYSKLGQDPIFLGLTDKPSPQDPVIGLKSINIIDGTYDFDRNMVMMPCLVSGSMTGLVARRDDHISGWNTNCDIKDTSSVDNKEGRYKISSNILCKKDNKLVREQVGGCPIELAFVDSSSATYEAKKKNGIVPNSNVPLNTSLTNITSVNQSSTDIQGAKGVTIIRAIYSENSYIKRTLPGDANFDRTLKAMEAYTNFKVRYPEFANYTGDVPYTTDATKFSAYSEPGSKDVKKLDKTNFLFRPDNGIAYPAGGSSTRLGVWFNTSEFDKSLYENIFSESNMQKFKLAGFYYNNNQPGEQNSLSKWIYKTSFNCKKRQINVNIQGVAHSIPIYEWVPASLVQLSSPTCENTTSTGSQIIDVPSSVKYDGTNTSRRIFICTPCIIPRLFQTDIFGQPVTGVPTAIGCLPASAPGMITVVVRIAVGVAGGIALLFVILAGIKIATSGDNPEEVKKAQQRISSAITGLLVIIFALLLLNIIGLKILDLSLFGGNQIEQVTGQ